MNERSVDKISGENIHFSHILFFIIVNFPSDILPNEHPKAAYLYMRCVRCPPTALAGGSVARLNSACQLIILDCHMPTSYYQLAIATQIFKPVYRLNFDCES